MRTLTICVLAVTVGLASQVPLLLCGCLTSSSESDRLAPVGAISRPDVQTKLRETLEAGRMLAQRGRLDDAVDLYRLTSLDLAQGLGSASDAGSVLTWFTAQANAEVTPDQRLALLERGIEEAIAAAEFSTIVSGPMLEGFPEPSPIGSIRIKQYPVVRTASAPVTTDRDGTFMALYNHLQEVELPMTSPVELTYAIETGQENDRFLAMQRIAFLYPNASQGSVGTEGQITVADVAPVTVVSVAIRGDYTASRFEGATATLRAWLADRPGQYVAVGPPRVLAYNSPFVPWFMKYSEVQIPIREDPAPDR